MVKLGKVQPSENKTDALMKLLEPKNIKQIQILFQFIFESLLTVIY